MVPDRAACEAVFARHPGRFWASEITAGRSVTLDDGLSHLRERGIQEAVIAPSLTTRAPKEDRLT